MLCAMLPDKHTALAELLSNIPETCPLLEKKLVWTRAGMSYDPYTPSVDRIHNHLGNCDAVGGVVVVYLTDPPVRIRSRQCLDC